MRIGAADQRLKGLARALHVVAIESRARREIERDVAHRTGAFREGRRRIAKIAFPIFESLPRVRHASAPVRLMGTRQSRAALCGGAIDRRDRVAQKQLARCRRQRLARRARLGQEPRRFRIVAAQCRLAPLPEGLGFGPGAHLLKRQWTPRQESRYAPPRFFGPLR